MVQISRNTPTQISLPATPHGGTQVVGTTNRNDTFNGLSYGQRQVNVALLDQSGNLQSIHHTIDFCKLQSTTGGYQHQQAITRRLLEITNHLRI